MPKSATIFLIVRTILKNLNQNNNRRSTVDCRQAQFDQLLHSLVSSQVPADFGHLTCHFIDAPGQRTAFSTSLITIEQMYCCSFQYQSNCESILPEVKVLKTLLNTFPVTSCPLQPRSLYKPD